MATSSIYRLPKTKEDGTIQEEKIIIDKDGSIKKVNEIIFTADSPVISTNFTDEINALIQSGQIEIPTSDQINSHIVDISSQLAPEKFSYNFTNSSGENIKCSDVYRIFFNGLNVSQDVDISADRMSFTFCDLYSGEDFGYPETRLVIDFIQETEG